MNTEKQIYKVKSEVLNKGSELSGLTTDTLNCIFRNNFFEPNKSENSGWTVNSHPIFKWRQWRFVETEDITSILVAATWGSKDFFEQNMFS